ncbi:MAG TPA: hotdog domain-containing protein, partial [Acidimicrobiales bacterium]|nr:hotdog domain-containing protein [Acidimicrobiales bacterium]
LSDLAAVRVVRSGTGSNPGALSATDMVLHYLAPARVGPVEARCTVVGARPDASVVRVAMYDTGVDDRLIALASVTVSSC